MFQNTYMDWKRVEVCPIVVQKTQRKGLQFSILMQEITEEIAEKALEKQQADCAENILEFILLNVLQDREVRKEFQSEKFQKFMKELGKDEEESKGEDGCIIS